MYLGLLFANKFIMIRPIILIFISIHTLLWSILLLSHPNIQQVNSKSISPTCKQVFQNQSSTYNSLNNQKYSLKLNSSEYLSQFAESKVFTQIIKSLNRATSTREWTLSQLGEIGIDKTNLNQIEQLINKIKLQVSTEEAWLELGIEISIQKYISENFFKVQLDESLDFDPIFARKSSAAYSGHHLGAQIKMLLENLNQYSDIELAAVNYKFESIFRKTYFHGIRTNKALEIAHWRAGPYADIETVAQLRKAIKEFSITFRYNYKEARQMCGDNIFVSSELSSGGLFTVPVRNSQSFFEHIYLLYYTPKGKIFIIDFSFNQFFSENIKGNDNMPFIGTDSDLKSIINENKEKLDSAVSENKTINLSGAPNKLVSLFSGELFLADTINFKSNIIEIIDNRLNQLKKDKSFQEP